MDCCVCCLVGYIIPFFGVLVRSEIDISYLKTSQAFFTGINKPVCSATGQLNGLQTSSVGGCAHGYRGVVMQ